jgi:hypothetical protein
MIKMAIIKSRNYSHSTYLENKMRKMLGLLCLLAGLLLAAACASTHYGITTLAGDKYVSEKEPKYDDDAKTYTFRDLEGKKVILNQSEIKEIRSLKED